MRQQRNVLTVGLAMVTSVMLGCEAREVEAPGDVPPAVATDPSAESQLIRLTGCLRPEGQPGRFVLASVATSGIMDGEAEQARSWTTEDETTWTDQQRAMAASTYLLLPADDQDLSEFQDQRVTVRGMLAAESPGGTAGAAATTGESTEVARDATTSKVEAEAPPALRALHVEEISKVADSCE